MSVNSQVVNGVKWTTLSTLILAAASILKISILTRFLDKSDFGLMALVTFVIGFMELFNDMGFTTAILHKQNISKEEYSTLYWLNIFASAILYILLILISPLISDFYKQGELKILIPIIGLNLIISSIGRQFKTIENKNLLFKNVAIIEIFGTLLSLIIAAGLAFRNYQIYSIVISSLVQTLFCNVLLLILGVRKYGLLLHFKFRESQPFLKIGGYQIGGQTINFFNRDLDILLIGRFFSPEILGGYSLAKQLVFRPAQIINPILTKVASPVLAKYQNDKSLLRVNYLKLINIVSTLNILVYSFIIIFAPWLLQILYGNGFDNIIILVRILSVSMIIRAIGNPVGSLVAATGRTDLEFVWNLATLFIMPIFIVIGAKLGIVQVSISITVAMILMFIPNWRLLIFKITGVSLKEYLIAVFKFDIKGLVKSLK